MQRLIRICLATAFLALTPALSSAQGTSVGSIVGVVKDTTGGVLPGVTVEASSPALIEKVRTTVTDREGRYQITELRPGTYAVVFSLTGFSQLKREGIVLTTNFTATVNAELGVGALDETVTVVRESPLVDTQNVTSQKTLTLELLSTVPTAKNMISMAALMPAATLAPGAQDVGGSRGESSIRLSMHGTDPLNSTLLLDGMTYNRTSSPGGRAFVINPLSAEEIVLDLGSGGSAEYSVAGVALNLVPKDGGNRFRSTVFAAGMTHALEGNNLSDKLKGQGLRTVNRINSMYDLNAVFAGPVIQDKLWFSTSHRRWGRNERIANLFHDSNLDDFLFTPDFNWPVDAAEDFRHHDIRLTWQAAAKHKVTGAVYWQPANNAADNLGLLSTGTIAIEASPILCKRVTVYQSTWTHPRTNRLLFEAGYNFQSATYDPWDNPCVGNPRLISVRDTFLNLTYNGQGVMTRTIEHPDVSRFSMSYVTGAHHFKTGVTTNTNLFQPASYTDRLTFLPVSYTLNNGVPTGLTQFAAPLRGTLNTHVNLSVFAQDQWRLNRLTLTGGVRYEYLNAWSPPVDQLGGLLVDAASFPGASCLPCWHDLNPRLAAAYDLFGDGKTAVKASIGRYAELLKVGWADTFAPWRAVVTSTTRAWTDTDGDFYPDCDLRNLAANGECRAVANSTFGKQQIRTHPDPDWITGWGKRGYTWMGSVSVDHELRPGVAVTAGYYRTWVGNFTVTDNLLVAPSDYDPYCITAPTDSRLPSHVSDRQICRFYDIAPSKFGLVDNVVTLAKNFGDQTEVYNGVDGLFNVRLRNGAQMAGGWNMGNTVNQFVTFPGTADAKSNNCFVVDSPQQLYQCETQNPYSHQFRVNGSIPLRGDIQVALVYQNLPGPLRTALLTVPTAAIAPTLGRNLAGGTRTVTIDLLERLKYLEDDRLSQLDVRFSKIFHLGRTRVQGNFDVYNALNDASVLQIQGQYNETWLQPTQILNARLFKFSVQLDF